jgi:hypothetical protein
MNRSDIIATRREWVLQEYNASKAENKNRFMEGDENATKEYIFENQIIDANNIVKEFYENNRRVISITKKTKVGMDGLMIELATRMTTHPDDNFVVNPKNVRILTGMSSTAWEKSMKEKSPRCFVDKIFHHGQLQKANLNNLQDALIIIDEIDTGASEQSVLDKALIASGVLDVNYMEKNNIRFVFASATMLANLYTMYRWGPELHMNYKMNIPKNYIGHTDFLKLGIIKEFYPIDTRKMAEKWIQEDILDNYGTDYRIHLVRSQQKTVKSLQDACNSKGVVLLIHTSTDTVEDKDLKNIFNNPINNHIVLVVKNFYRRATLIPNNWKLRIGATHELYTKIVDDSVQIQAFPGRMTGYWRDMIEGGHKTGPYRTCIKSIENYEKTYNEPFGLNSYGSSTFKKTNGIVTSEKPTMVSAKNIIGLEVVELPVIKDINDPKTVPIVIKISDMEYSSIIKNANSWDINSICNIIKKYNESLAIEIERINLIDGKDQIVEPSSSTYDTYITKYITESIKNKPIFHVGNIKDKKRDKFQIYLDNIGKQIIISLYYGSKLLT